MSLEWTDNNVDWLKRLWAEGKSASVIAQILGSTRSAVLGKVSRIKLGPHTTREQKPHTAGNSNRFVPHAKASSSPVNGYVRSLAPDKPLPAFARPEPLEAIVGISFMELTDRKCKWALNDASPWVFCGVKSVEHKPFCEAQGGRAYHAIGGTR